MAYTQVQIDLLKSNAAKGILRGRLGDEEVQFASLKEMRRQISVMEAELRGQPRGALGISYPKTSRGL
ncbi:MAG: hypothetical protein ABJL67_13515 [Sulfitobacter sp.]